MASLLAYRLLTLLLYHLLGFLSIGFINLIVNKLLTKDVFFVNSGRRAGRRPGKKKKGAYSPLSLLLAEVSVCPVVKDFARVVVYHIATLICLFEGVVIKGGSIFLRKSGDMLAGGLAISAIAESFLMVFILCTSQFFYFVHLEQLYNTTYKGKCQ